MFWGRVDDAERVLMGRYNKVARVDGKAVSGGLEDRLLAAPELHQLEASLGRDRGREGPVLGGGKRERGHLGRHPSRGSLDIHTDHAGSRHRDQDELTRAREIEIEVLVVRDPRLAVLRTAVSARAIHDKRSCGATEVRAKQQPEGCATCRESNRVSATSEAVECVELVRA